MEDKIEIIEFIMNKDIFVVFLFFAILLLRNPKELILSLDTWKTFRTGNLEEALKSPSVKGISRKLIEEKLEQRHFYLSTGLNVEKIVREKILQIYEHSSGKVRFIHFVRAKDHYRFENSELSVSWGTFQTFFLWFYFFSSLLFFGGSLFVLFIIITGFFTDAIIDQRGIIDILPAALVLFITMILSLKSWVTLVSTNTVREEIAAFNENNGVLKPNKHSRPSSNF